MGDAIPVTQAWKKDGTLSRYMVQHGLKHTRQRSLIIDTFFATGGHLSVEDVLSQVGGQNLKGSMGAGFRAMEFLSEVCPPPPHHFRARQHPPAAATLP